MEGRQPLIDVIVPVYNTEQYLEKCIDSLLDQEFSDYCITLVDDGSTDSSPAICDGYASRFPDRVRVIHKTNEGPSAARNAGVEASQSKLIAFADSDDTVSRRYLSALYDALTRFDADMAVSPVCKVFPRADGSVRYQNPPVMEAALLNRDRALEELCYEKYFSSFPVGKLLYRETALAHPFPVGRYFEDSFTVYRQIMDCTKIAYTPEISYFYLQRPGSIQRHKFEQRHQDLLDASKEILEVFSRAQMPQPVLDAAAYKMCRACYITLFHAADLGREEFGQVWRRVLPLWPDGYLAGKGRERFSPKERVLFRLACKHRQLFYTIVRTLGAK